MKRRYFLRMSGLNAGSIVFGGHLTLMHESCRKSERSGLVTKPVMVSEGSFSKLLPIPATVGPSTSLAAQVTTATVGSGAIPVLGYQQGKMLGPTFKVQSGTAMDILLQNQLSEQTNVHWHGLKVPALMDGHPDQVANPGGSFHYQFTINQRAGLSWYHPHPHGATGRQVFQGLAGLFIVNDAEESSLNLPVDQYEIPLIIQDKRFDGDGIVYSPSMTEVMAGYMGDSIFVNGLHAPYTEVATRFYRMRILNGSNARIYNLAWSNNADFTIIGNDGGLLKTPETLKEILIAPGERIDVLMDFSRVTVGSEVWLVSKAFEFGGDAQGKQTFRIMNFKVTTQSSASFMLATNLSNIADISPSSVARTRVFEISNVMMHHGVPMNNGMVMRHRINGKLFDSARIDEEVTANTNEIWVFDNSDGDEPHPMHLHGLFFQVTHRIGGRGRLIATEGGWKDTVLVMPGEVVKIIIPFDNNLGKFVFHCHNLEHEDDGMMLQYQIK